MPRSTFINDRSAETYPFAPTVNALLPFSPSCVRELRICVKKESDKAGLPEFYVSGVEISAAGTVAVSLCAGDDIQLCRLTASAQGASDVLSAEFYWGGLLYLASCLMFAGVVHEADEGTYSVHLPLALGCVHTMPSDVYSGIDSLQVNGVRQELPETLHVDTQGYFTTAVEPLQGSYEGYPRLSATLSADIPQGALLSTQPTSASTYKHVTAVNGHVMAENSCLVIQPEHCPQDAEDKKAVLLTFEDLGMVASGSGNRRLSEDEEVRAYEKHNGNVCFVNLQGTSSFPHCYGDSDMAGSATAFHTRGNAKSTGGQGSSSTTGQQGMMGEL